MFLEDTAVFLDDFGVECVSGATTFKGILDHPTDIIADGMMLSDNYDLTYLTASVSLVINTSITVGGISYKIRDVRVLDNGTFSSAHLSKN